VYTKSFELDAMDAHNEGAKNLLPYLESHSVRYSVAFYADVMKIVNLLSLNFQKENVLLVDVGTLVRASLNRLQFEFIENDCQKPYSPYLKDLFKVEPMYTFGCNWDTDGAIGHMKEFVQRLVEQIEARFPRQTEDVAADLCVLFPKSFPTEANQVSEFWSDPV
jgi:hypothetical protein